MVCNLLVWHLKYVATIRVELQMHFLYASLHSLLFIGKCQTTTSTQAVTMTSQERERQRERNWQLGTCNVPLATTSGQVAASGLKPTKQNSVSVSVSYSVLNWTGLVQMPNCLSVSPVGWTLNSNKICGQLVFDSRPKAAATPPTQRSLLQRLLYTLHSLNGYHEFFIAFDLQLQLYLHILWSKCLPSVNL